MQLKKSINSTGIFIISMMTLQRIFKPRRHFDSINFKEYQIIHQFQSKIFMGEKEKPRRHFKPIDLLVYSPRLDYWCMGTQLS